MSETIDPGHAMKRTILRILGPALIVAGVVLMAVAVLRFLEMFRSLPNGPEGGMYLYSAIPFFLGGGILFVVGWAITSFAFMGAVARYQAGEVVPVGRDAFNVLAQETRPGVRAVASAVGEGLRGLVDCASCGTSNDVDARFCDSCGMRLA